MIKIVCTSDEYRKINYADVMCPIVKALGTKCLSDCVDCLTCVSSHIEFKILDKEEKAEEIKVQDYEKMWEALKDKINESYAIWQKEAGSLATSDLPYVLDWMKKFESGELPIH